MAISEAEVRSALGALVDPNTGKDAYRKAITKVKFEAVKEMG